MKVSPTDHLAPAEPNASRTQSTISVYDRHASRDSISSHLSSAWSEETSHCEPSPRLPHSIRPGETIPFDIVSASCDAVGHFLAHQIERCRNSPVPSPFDALSEPKISLACYFERIQQYSQATPETVICAVVLIRRIAKLTGLHITNLNAHRLLICAIMIFSKFYDDAIDSNGRWARIGGIKKGELNNLEVDFLNRCQFDLRVSPQEFTDMVFELIRFQEKPGSDPVSEDEGYASDASKSSRSSKSSAIKAFHVKKAPARRRSYYYGDAAHEKRSIMSLFHPDHVHLNRFNSCSPCSLNTNSPCNISSDSSHPSPETPQFVRQTLSRGPSLQQLSALLHLGSKTKSVGNLREKTVGTKVSAQ